MKKLLKLGIYLSLVLPCLGSIHAQDNNLRAVSRRKFKHDANIVTVYNKAKNQTEVVMHWYHVPEKIREPELFPRNEAPIYGS
jgi:hypothetical protein